MYNAIAYVPYQLERLLWYGLLLCCNSFLATFTLLPIRFIRAVGCLVRQQRHKGVSKLKGDQLFDIICVGMFVVTVLFLRHLNAGAIYFWIKDLTQEFLKLQVIYTAVELFDKVHFLHHPFAQIPHFTRYHSSQVVGVATGIFHCCRQSTAPRLCALMNPCFWLYPKGATRIL